MNCETALLCNNVSFLARCKPRISPGLYIPISREFDNSGLVHLNEYIGSIFHDELINCSFVYIMYLTSYCNASVNLFYYVMYVINETELASCQWRKIAGFPCTGNAGNVFPATDFK